MNKNDTLHITMSSKAISGWNFLLQKGFTLHGYAGMTVRDFLRESVGYDDCLIDEQVRTVFLNSSPVDDIDSAFVKEGDRVALGSAMPGLVGICMGRDNPYKEFRSGISVGDESVAKTAESVSVFVKIFSTLAVDTGVDVLGRGIEINAQLLADFLNEKATLVISCGDVELDVLVDQLKKIDDGVRVVVEFE